MILRPNACVSPVHHESYSDVATNALAWPLASSVFVSAASVEDYNCAISAQWMDIAKCRRIQNRSIWLRNQTIKNDVNKLNLHSFTSSANRTSNTTMKDMNDSSTLMPPQFVIFTGTDVSELDSLLISSNISTHHVKIENIQITQQLEHLIEIAAHNDSQTMAVGYILQYDQIPTNQLIGFAKFIQKNGMVAIHFVQENIFMDLISANQTQFPLRNVRGLVDLMEFQVYQYRSWLKSWLADNVLEVLYHDLFSKRRTCLDNIFQLLKLAALPVQLPDEHRQPPSCRLGPTDVKGSLVQTNMSVTHIQTNTQHHILQQSTTSHILEPHNIA